MPLTDISLRAAKPRATPYKLADEKGLFVLVQPTGGKLWRLKYRFNGKEKKLALGTYPDTGLKEARARHDEARKQLEAGVDPGEQKKRDKVAQALSDEFHGLLLVQRPPPGGQRWRSDKSRSSKQAHSCRSATEVEQACERLAQNGFEIGIGSNFKRSRGTA